MELLALIFSFIAMSLIAASYFMKGKSGFLMLQAFGIVFLMASYLCTKEFFAMVGLGIGLGRMCVYFLFERKDKKPSVFWPILFSALSMAAYFVVNFVILQTTKWYDVIYLIGLICYAFIFWIRNLEKMLFLTTIPTTLSILYNVVSRAPVFAVISYTFELGANLVVLWKYLAKKKRDNGTKEKK